MKRKEIQKEAEFRKYHRAAYGIIEQRSDAPSNMKEIIQSICELIFTLKEYERKQIISVLICSMLTEQSNKDAKEIYDNIINLLNK